MLLFAVAPIFVALGCALASASGGTHELVRLIIPTALVWMIQVATFVVINRAWGIPLPYALAGPLGHLLFAAILFNSIRLIVSGRGVRWKDRTLYARDGGVRPPREPSSKLGKSFRASFTDE